VIWFEEPEESLQDPIRFVTYAMAYAVHEDMKIIRQHVTDDEMCEVLEHAPPGIIDGRSWAYWHVKLDRIPIPDLPARSLD